LSANEKAVNYYVAGSQISTTRMRYSFPPMTVLFPEFHNYAPRKGTQTMLQAGNINPNQITEMWLSQFRKQGVSIVADTQSPKKLDGISQEHFRWWAIGRNPWKKELFKQESFPYIPEEIIEDFITFQPGMWFVAQIGSMDFDKPFLSCPSLSKHKEVFEAPLDVMERTAGLEWVEYRVPISQTVRGGIFRAKEVREKVRNLSYDLKRKAVAVLAQQGFRVKDIIDLLGISKSTFYDWGGKKVYQYNK
jgi:transposase